LGDDGYTYGPLQNVKYGATVENTDYAARNFDLRLGMNGITCFEMGAHRLYNAGVDLYRVGSSTAGAQVRAVANGVVASLGSNVIVLSHTIPGTSPVFSLYGNITVSAALTVGAVVGKGTMLGTVMPLTYTGNFPEFHPTGDHAHLHFEIRNFADATVLGLPAACNAQAGPAGVGYIYPNHPSSYGYLDPLAFLRLRVPAHRLYLPVVQNGPVTPTCQNGQNLAQNGGFEDGALSDPPPWLEISTRYAWNAPLVSTSAAYQGQNGGRWGGWGDGVAVGEELGQSLVIPSGIFSMTWRTTGKLMPDNSVSDPDDYFLLSFYDAHTGENLPANGGTRLSDFSIPANTWFLLRLHITNMGGSDGRKIIFSYNAWNDESQPTQLFVDGVEFITYCAATDGPAGGYVENGGGNGWQWDVSITPLPVREYNADK